MPSLKILEEEIGEAELDTIDIEENKSLGELMKELDSLIGLSEIKEKREENYFAFENRSFTSSQLMTFHQAAM